MDDPRPPVMVGAPAPAEDEERIAATLDEWRRLDPDTYPLARVLTHIPDRMMGILEFLRYLLTEGFVAPDVKLQVRDTVRSLESARLAGELEGWTPPTGGDDVERDGALEDDLRSLAVHYCTAFSVDYDNVPGEVFEALHRALTLSEFTELSWSIALFRAMHRVQTVIGVADNSGDSPS